MKPKTPQKLLLTVNALTVAAILSLNYVYQSNGFDFTLKCICSGAFALLGLFNLVYALTAKAANRRFFMAMAAGLANITRFSPGLTPYAFFVGNLRLTDLGFYLKFAQQAVYDNFQVQFTHTCDNGLTGAFVGIGFKGGVFFSQAHQCQA